MESLTHERDYVTLDDYKSMMVQELNTAWELARETIEKAQKRQKRQYDKAARNATFGLGEKVFLSLPALKTGPWRKLARPFKGPYEIVKLYPNGAEIRLVGGPQKPPLRVALNRLRRCPEELQGCAGAAPTVPGNPDVLTPWTPESPPVDSSQEATSPQEDQPASPPQDAIPDRRQPRVWEGRLRTRKVD